MKLFVTGEHDEKKVAFREKQEKCNHRKLKEFFNNTFQHLGRKRHIYDQLRTSSKNLVSSVRKGPHTCNTQLHYQKI